MSSVRGIAEKSAPTRTSAVDPRWQYSSSSGTHEREGNEQTHRHRQHSLESSNQSARSHVFKSSSAGNHGSAGHSWSTFARPDERAQKREELTSLWRYSELPPTKKLKASDAPDPAIPLLGKPGTFLQTTKKINAVRVVPRPLAAPAHALPCPLHAPPSAALAPTTPIVPNRPITAPIAPIAAPIASPVQLLSSATRPTASTSTSSTQSKGVTPRSENRKPPKLPVGVKAAEPSSALPLQTCGNSNDDVSKSALRATEDAASIVGSASPEENFRSKTYVSQVPLPAAPSAGSARVRSVQAVGSALEDAHRSVDSMTIVSPAYSTGDSIEEHVDVAELKAEFRASLRVLGECVLMLAEGTEASGVVGRKLAECGLLAPSGPAASASASAASMDKVAASSSATEDELVRAWGEGRSPSVADLADAAPAPSRESESVATVAELSGRATSPSVSEPSSDASPKIVDFASALALVTDTATRANWLDFLFNRKYLTAVFERSMREVSPLLLRWLREEVAGMRSSVHTVNFLNGFIKLYPVSLPYYVSLWNPS